jgi:hypothetical protein
MREMPILPSDCEFDQHSRINTVQIRRMTSKMKLVLTQFEGRLGLTLTKMISISAKMAWAAWYLRITITCRV